MARTKEVRSAANAGSDERLRLYGVRSESRPGRHEYEFYISRTGDRKEVGALQGALSFSLPITAFLPRARDAMCNEYGRGCYAHREGGPGPLVRLGMIDFRTVQAEGKSIAYALNYKPKGEIGDPVQNESRGTGMGGRIESCCLKDLRRTVGATHMTTTAGLVRYLSAIPGFDDVVGMLASFTDSESRVGQLMRCGIGPADVLEIGEWARRVAGPALARPAHRQSDGAWAKA